MIWGREGDGGNWVVARRGVAALGQPGVVVMAVLEVLRGVDVAADSPGQVCRGWEREYESPFSPPHFRIISLLFSLDRWVHLFLLKKWL